MDPTTGLVVLGVAAVVLVGLVLGAVWTGWRMREAEVEREHARAERLAADLAQEREEREADQARALRRARGAALDAQALDDVAAAGRADDPLLAGLLLARQSANEADDDGSAPAPPGESVGTPEHGGDRGLGATDQSG